VTTAIADEAFLLIEDRSRQPTAERCIPAGIGSGTAHAAPVAIVTNRALTGNRFVTFID